MNQLLILYLALSQCLDQLEHFINIQISRIIGIIDIKQKPYFLLQTNLLVLHVLIRGIESPKRNSELLEINSSVIWVLVNKYVDDFIA